MLCSKHIQYPIFSILLLHFLDNGKSFIGGGGSYITLMLKFILYGYFALLKNHDSTDFVRLNYG